MGSLLGPSLGFLVLLLTFSPSHSYGVFSNFTEPATNATSPFDPFYALRLRAQGKVLNTICCLNPLNSEPLPTDAEFVSFEEWKSKQRELHGLANTNRTPPDASQSDVPSGSHAVSSLTPGDSEPPASIMVDSASPPSLHFRVPLTDRFNYASLECSARIHSSHESARSPTAILTSKKDKYMLSPCSASPNFVVVELCDDIRIDTVQLANFEFFSGVFQDVKVSVAQTFTSDGQGWVEAGTYRAKNIRAVQSFHPLVELRPFYRYIRIDFLSYYGTEFYCPISLLRVYGLTQMEEWKWEVWQSGPENNNIQTLSESEDTTTSPEIAPVETGNATTARELKEGRNMAAGEPASGIAPLEHTQDLAAIQSPDTQIAPASSFLPSTVPKHSSTLRVLSTVVEAPEPTMSDMSVQSTLREASASTGTPTDVSSTHPNVTVGPVFHSASYPSVQSTISSPSTSPIAIGESIYRTIMNRLAMLETNATLYQQYVEEQTLQIREALRRLEENVGRLEGISKAQQQVFTKTIQELELKRRQMDEERWELLIKVNLLADEVTLEKRLGIAQLCLLLAVLVFMALTRGSRVSLPDGAVYRLNSFSGHGPWTATHWSPKRRVSRSQTPTRMDYTMAKKELREEDRDTSSLSLRHQLAELKSSGSFPSTPPARTPRSSARPTTPRRHELRVMSENHPLGRRHRSSSHATPAAVSLSAKRFVHTAHLHEVQRSAKKHEEIGRRPDDGFVLSDASPRSRRSRTEPSSAYLPIGFGKFPFPTSRGEETDAGSWVDTEGGADSDSESKGDGGPEEEEELGNVKSEFENRTVVPLISTPPAGRKAQRNPSSPNSSYFSNP